MAPKRQTNNNTMTRSLLTAAADFVASVSSAFVAAAFLPFVSLGSVFVYSAQRENVVKNASTAKKEIKI
jgi:hypothetical protein